MNIKKEELGFFPFNKDTLSTLLRPVIMLGVKKSRTRDTVFSCLHETDFSGEGGCLNTTKNKVPGTMDHKRRST